MNIFDKIQKPTLLLDEARARQNIRRMAEKARQQGIRFRPHFKTHQSAQVGEWFREEGVTCITVSSLEMAEYFAAHGWKDITIAFPVNLRQLNGLRDLARNINLGILVEDCQTVETLRESVKHPMRAWIKVDSGLGRTGILWQDNTRLAELAQVVSNAPHLELKGLLTHAGHTYSAGNPEGVRRVYAESVVRINEARAALEKAGFLGLECSVGDTPGCSLSESFGEVDEIRPGNFVFYDAQMLNLGACGAENIAAVLACPIVASHPERNEAVIYGGAIHLSKDDLYLNGQRAFGLVGLPEGKGWSAPIPGAFVRSISQEHGVLRLPPEVISKFPVGGLALVYPAHICLAVTLMRGYRTMSGETITIL